MSQNACFPFLTLEQHTTFKDLTINRLSNLINRNRSAAKISQVLCSNIYVLMIYQYIIYTRDGRGSYFFHGAGRGGEGLGKKCMGRGGAGNPPFPTVRGGAGKGSKSAGRGGAGEGNILRVLIEIICCSKEISICIALSEVNLLNIHNLDRNHN